MKWAVPKRREQRRMAVVELRKVAVMAATAVMASGAVDLTD